MGKYNSFQWCRLVGNVFDTDRRIGQVFLCEESHQIEIVIPQSCGVIRLRLGAKGLPMSTKVYDLNGVDCGTWTEFDDLMYDGPEAFGVSRTSKRRFVVDSILPNEPSLNLLITVDTVSLSSLITNQ